jgi:outer membrane protein OmpA-like peptidoglycan-associated protein
MIRFAACCFAACFLTTTGFATTHKKTAGPRPPLTIVTDQSWDVSARPLHFGEYPLSAEQVAAPAAPLHGGTGKAVAAAYNERSKIVPGSVPIWRNREADSEGEAYQFRKTVALGPDPIVKATLEINCDDVARVYINQRLASVDKRDGKLKDGYDDWFTFRSVSGFMYDRIYTYDVTDYFFTNVTNNILIEAVSLAFDGSHAYISAKIVIEFGAVTEPPRPAKAKAPSKPKAGIDKKATGQQAGKTAPEPAMPEKTVFEAGRDPEIEKLRVGSVLELGNVYFKPDDYRLDSASYRTLAALAGFLKRHPGLKIEVGGHTNLRPGERFAAELSTNRARSVVQYLTDNGIAAGRVTYKGYGKSQPRIKAVSKEADRANQRVELKVLEK